MDSGTREFELRHDGGRLNRGVLLVFDVGAILFGVFLLGGTLWVLVMGHFEVALLASVGMGVGFLAYGMYSVSHNVRRKVTVGPNGVRVTTLFRLGRHFSLNPALRFVDRPYEAWWVSAEFHSEHALWLDRPERKSYLVFVDSGWGLSVGNEGHDGALNELNRALQRHL